MPEGLQSNRELLNANSSILFPAFGTLDLIFDLHIIFIEGPLRPLPVSIRYMYER